MAKATVIIHVAGTDLFTMIVERGEEPIAECAYDQPVGSNTVILCDVFRHELEDLCQRWQHLLRQAHKLDKDE